MKPVWQEQPQTGAPKIESGRGAPSAWRTSILPSPGTAFRRRRTLRLSNRIARSRKARPPAEPEAAENAVAVHRHTVRSLFGETDRAPGIDKTGSRNR